MKIHVSETIKDLLDSAGFKTSKRGTIEVKVGTTSGVQSWVSCESRLQGKGTMNTYWVNDYEGADPRAVIDQVSRAGASTADSLEEDFGSSDSFCDMVKSQMSIKASLQNIKEHEAAKAEKMKKRAEAQARAEEERRKKAAAASAAAPATDTAKPADAAASVEQTQQPAAETQAQETKTEETVVPQQLQQPVTVTACSKACVVQ
jgi:hypothetical protein